MIKCTHIHLLMLKIDLLHQVCCWSHGLRSHLLHTIFIAVVLKWKSSPGCSPFHSSWKVHIISYYMHDCPWNFPYLDRILPFLPYLLPMNFPKSSAWRGCRQPPRLQCFGLCPGCKSSMAWCTASLCHGVADWRRWSVAWSCAPWPAVSAVDVLQQQLWWWALQFYIYIYIYIKEDTPGIILRITPSLQV